MRTAVKRLKRWLHLGHRWLGIVTGLLVVAWLVSGLVMLFVGFPALTEGERRAALPPLALAAVRLTPQEVLERAGLAGFPARFTLAMRGSEPVYWITGPEGRRRALSAVTGDPVPPLTPEGAVALAATHPAARQVRDLGPVTRDQWTVTARYDPLRPFRRVALGDPAGTELYLSVPTGELVLDTTRAERAWNWIGAVTHWIYLTPLRAREGLWRDAVLWLSGLALAAGASGTLLGFLRLMRGRLTPYRGWAAWHHLAGVAGGLVLVTFLLSGWLSMNPRGWFGPRAPDAAMRAAYAGQAAPVFPLGLDALARAPAGTLALDLAWIGGRPLVTALGREGAGPCCGTALTEEEVVAAGRAMLPGAALRSATRLEAPDDYWYDRSGTPPLPVLRLGFDDPAATWIHLDPVTGAILGRIDRSGRASRWLFDALHTLDAGPLARHPVVRQAVVGAASALGLVIATSGVVLGWRRLRRRHA
ncbi:PepSY domain-containing protein [Methylobacterium nonmethylotrophicum]|uniref:PepSY domain-containing protein n=1 Tax=Methylobacterium nonmethylotrophicum TaxID=1141884 RepID=A0A4Z0NXZ9_9HYPH|nr:PepSY domain-containing protein [Methylobacterium nonmethylotrophicum]TGE02535.1 PepSY domain-containing protein [Methylobacterium nonmethylotrophicum]